MYLGQHADEGMVDVLSRRCARQACSTEQSYNVLGREVIVYGMQLAEEGVVDTISKYSAPNLSDE